MTRQIKKKLIKMRDFKMLEFDDEKDELSGEFYSYDDLMKEFEGE